MRLAVATLTLGLTVSTALAALGDRDAVRRYFERDDRRLLLGAGVARAALYWDRVAPAAARHGVPADVFFAVALAESQFNPHAVSPTGAEGMWQFTPPTGTEYGLPNRGARFDPERSADAAARYLARLDQRFGDLDLAVAAYNLGPTALAATLRRHRAASWSAVRPHVRAETRDYVPKIDWIAAAIYPAFLAGTASDAGVRVELAQAGDTLYGFARVHGAAIEELRMLNRGDLRPGTPIAVPPRVHLVAAGESLESLAATAGVSITEIVRANDQLIPGDPLEAGAVLRIPVTQASN